MSDVDLMVRDGVPVVSSREVAKKFEKQHTEVLKKIGGYDRNGKHVDGILDQFEPSVNTLRYIIPSEYVDSKGETRKEYLLTRDGFSLVVMGFTGSKALEWKLKYIDAFDNMDKALSEQSNPVLPGTYIEALEQLLIKAKECEILVERNQELTIDNDRYQRFLCEKTQELKKSELAVKLDVSPQRLASRLKSIGVYTAKSSKVSQEFLDKHPGVKIIMEHEVKYSVDGEEHLKIEWQWTHEGAKAVVDELIDKGMVEFTENEGFKLK